MPGKYQFPHLHTFHELSSFSFSGSINACCWTREMPGDFQEIAGAITPTSNITLIEERYLKELRLSAPGQKARDLILTDLQLLKEQGAAPVLNLITHYERDTVFPFFPVDVYSYHVDRSPVQTDTFLCTYFGEASEIMPNDLAKQKISMPELRAQLRQHFKGSEQEFESFLTEHFFDLHYEPNAGAQPVKMGIGELWRLAVDHPGLRVPPCIHRAPMEKPGEKRLLLIC